MRVKAVFVGSGDGVERLNEASSDARVAEQLAQASIYEVDESVLTAILDPVSPRPVAAMVEAPDWSVGDVAVDRPVLIAVELRDPGNIGTIIRSAEAAGCGAVITAGDAVDYLNPKAVRASAGSLFRIPVMRRPNVEELVGELRAGGRSIVATVVRSDALPYEQVDLRSTAILVGNEPHGLSLETVALADTAVTIPMADGVESLNVAAAAAILAFESARQRRQN